ncbi:dolichyl-phosphate-mannose--protein mannosyltransferase [Nocardioides nematodiphilus]|uniref:dolichyl-phosphate-mannose--protein mannosyltransferase n=1 Tax=Nocardioides nematodiphilus TaxID=2849669 RepID=UPI001CD9BCF5|nr:phospholipid carrier-dependent glycosyltransferase [Nocardioides nematodiphilus]MCA1983164.1 phospholipid carrier-dependent glycosyltransferase [Nocardioides nematodiphilus]
MTSAPPSNEHSTEPKLITLSRTALGRPVPSAWRRATARATDEDPVISWVISIAITVMAFLMRIWHLGIPHLFAFDETYYAKDGWSLLHYGYARNAVTDADKLILAGTTDPSKVFSPDGAEMIVHPEVGKWLIALGEKAFGMDPFGWRIAAAVIGSLMILVLIRLVRRMTGSTMLGAVAGLLLAFDGLEFVLSRLALLDIFGAFFILLAVHFMVMDRDWLRAKMARLTPTQVPYVGAGAWGPVRKLLFRPWLLAAGITWGLAIGTKWDAAYPLAAFGLLYVAWCAGARRMFGVLWSMPKALLADGITAFVHLVVVAAIVYTGTWTGWLMNHRVYEESLSSTQYTQFTGSGHCDPKNKTTFVADNPDPHAKWPTAATAKTPMPTGLDRVTVPLRSLWYYHQDVFTFHTHFLNCATHTYASHPAAWPLLNRPVGVAADTGIKPGAVSDGETCQAPTGDTCLRQVLLLGTPVLWWGGALALIAALILWVGARDWRYGVAVVGALSTWLPWLQYADRPIFSYYAISMIPFTVLAIVLCMGRMMGTARVSSPQRTVGVIVSGAFFLLVLANFAWFWPIYTNELLTHGQWLSRIWFSRWI